MLLMEMKMTADPEQVAAIKEANDVVTEWATIEFVINGTPCERRTYNLQGVLDILTDAVTTQVLTPSEGVEHFRKLTEQGETVISHLDPLGSADDDPMAKALLVIGNLTETGKDMTDEQRTEALASALIERVLSNAFDGLDEKHGVVGGTSPEERIALRRGETSV